MAFPDGWGTWVPRTGKPNKGSSDGLYSRLSEGRAAHAEHR